MRDTRIGIGWRVHSWWAVVVAVTGPPASPVVVHREQVTLVEDESMREPYHAATAVPLGEAPSLIGSVARAAAASAEATLRGFVSSLGAVAAVGVVGGNRRLPELPQILAKHARLHEAERDLYERAIIKGAARTSLPVTTIPARATLLSEASDVLGVALDPTLAALGKSIGPPWQKNYKEATAAALVALGALG
ncbi:MAG TPA: hypothetical protein VM143_01450 [Acidimicrobiales bacterium]|nr:hypothetical protein [Acidimicrobiales bacterium]